MANLIFGSVAEKSRKGRVTIRPCESGSMVDIGSKSIDMFGFYMSIRSSSNTIANVPVK